MTGSNQRTRLRAMEPEDLDLLYRIENDVELWDVGTTSVPYSRYVLHDFLASSSGDIYTDKQLRLVVENEDAEVVGLLDLCHFDPKHLRSEVGMVIERPWRQKGYGLEALQQCIAYARRTLHLHQLYAVVSSDNEAALRLFAAAGFKSSACLSEWLFDGDGYRDAVVMQRTL